MIRLLVGDCRDALKTLPDESVQCVITSPPYWSLREYNGDPGMIGMERIFAEHVSSIVDVFGEVRRVLKDSGTLWLNYGDAYSTGKNSVLPAKNLMMMPAQIAMALQHDGWILRSEIIFNKLNPMPESVSDRPTSSHEKIFLFAKSHNYYYDVNAVKTEYKDSSMQRLNQETFYDQSGGEKDNKSGNRSHRKTLENIKKNKQDMYGPRHAGFNKRWKQRGHKRPHQGFNEKWDDMSKEQQMENGARLRNVWSMGVHPYRGMHFATFPPELASRCILSGSMKDSTILDPFAGSGTVGMVAERHNRNAILIEISPIYAGLAKERIDGLTEDMFPVVNMETIEKTNDQEMINDQQD